MESDRRNFYRLQDNVYIEYRVAGEKEVKEGLKGLKRQTPKADDPNYQLDVLSRQIAPLLSDISVSLPTVAQYLDGLNRKIDLLSTMVFYEHFVNTQDIKSNLTSNTIDISEGGISFFSQEAYREKTYFYLRLVIIGFKYGLETYGQVAHCREAEDANDNKGYIIGIEFPHLSDYDQKQLSRYIYDRQRELIRKSKMDF